MLLKRLLFFTSLFFLISSCTLFSRKKNGAESFVFPQSYLALLDSGIRENSGIIYWNNFIWTFNDSGGKNELYALNPETGNITITVVLSNAMNTDWEDIAQNEKYIFIAETGNNAGTRTDLNILRLKKASLGLEPFQEVEAEKIFFSFADQKDFDPLFRQNPYDCEALVEWNDSLYVFTKDWVNFITKAYVMPNVPGSYNLYPVDSFDVQGLVTGADINAAGTLAMVGYQDFQSFVWLFKKDNEELFSAPRFIDLSMLENAQTEGICFLPSGELLISCEQTISHLQQIWKLPPSAKR
ncbi:MAG: hypothetical protein JXR22_04960 [Prolixibacteraceae bacterium]|nr:hypothetical protein [Prolixibacteraceae bacterium]